MIFAPRKGGAIHANEREQMRAGLRLGIAIAAAGLGVGAAPALAQSAPPEATTNTPATDSIGPRELQNFNLQGTVTKSAEQPAPAPTAPRRTPTITTALPEPTDQPTPGRVQAPAPPAAEPTRIAAVDPERSRVVRSQPAPSSSVTTTLPPLSPSSIAADERGNPPSPAAEPAVSSVEQQGSFPLPLWLLAAAVLGIGGAFLFWRNRSREAFAHGPQIDAYLAPEPAPAPRPGPAVAPSPTPAPPPKAAVPDSVGIVSTRLRPWLELTFDPIRCVVDDEKVTFEFELGLFNSGSAPARDVLIEATLFNAGPEQEREIAAFFAAPVGQGQRIATIPPLQRMKLRTEVSAPRTGLQLFEIGGRHVIVPLIGFNALYRWGASDGQTSQSFLLGRDTKGEKLAPFRMDLGPRVFRGLAARPLPQAVRN